MNSKKRSFIFQPVSIKPSNIDENIIKFQNPYNTEKPIQIKSNHSQELFALQLFNIEGKIIFEKKINSNCNVYIDNKTKPGLYFLVLSDIEKILSTKKIIIE